jgi:hypothetical protein
MRAKKEARREHKASGGGKWIQKAIGKPGSLHKQLGIPQGKKIPMKTLHEAEHSDNALLRKRANLAETLRGFHH